MSEVQPHSVQVSWQAVEGADMYTVTFTQTMGDEQQGLCTTASHSVTFETSNMNIDVAGEDDDDMLRAFLTYSITVAAVLSDVCSSQDSQPMTVTTAQTSRKQHECNVHVCYSYSLCAISPTDSTAALDNFRATAQSSSSISVQWNGLTPCKDVNGLIVEFRVQYRALPSGSVQTLPHSVQSEIWNMPVEVSLTGLIPFTNYSIQAAPVNDQSQVGSYSGPVVTQTQEDSETIALYIVYYIIQHMALCLPPAPGPVNITSSSPSFFKISITWNPPEIRNGIIIAYEVSYRPASAPQTITTMNTTDLDTSFTGLELGTTYIFTVTAFTRAGRGEIATDSISTLARPRKIRALCVTSTHTGIQNSYDISSTQCMYVYSHSLTAAVQGVEVTALNSTAVTVSWNALVIPDFSINHYTVLYSRVESQRRRRQDEAMSAQFPSTATSGVIAGLDSTATYQFQVFATVTVDGTPLEGERSSPARVPDGE